jgi:hypothetical protein
VRLPSGLNEINQAFGEQSPVPFGLLPQNASFRGQSVRPVSMWADRITGEVAYEFPNDYAGAKAYGELLQGAQEKMLNSPNKRIRENAAGVLVRPPDYYQGKYRLFVSGDGLAGISLGIGKQDGYLGGLFNASPFADSKALARLAIEQGGGWADYFGDARARAYAMGGGMQEAARVSYANLKSKLTRPLDGEPDLVFGYLATPGATGVKLVKTTPIASYAEAQSRAMQAMYSARASWRDAGISVPPGFVDRTVTPVSRQLPERTLTSTLEAYEWWLKQ